MKPEAAVLTTQFPSNPLRMWTLEQWSGELGQLLGRELGSRWFYRLGHDNAPRSIKIAGRRVVVEAPQDYLQRIADVQLAA